MHRNARTRRAGSHPKPGDSEPLLDRADVLNGEPRDAGRVSDFPAHDLERLATEYLATIGNQSPSSAADAG